MSAGGSTQGASAQAGGALLEQIGAQTQSAWGALFAPDCADIARPTDLANLWGVESTLAIRLFQAIREPDAVVSLQRLPSPSALRTVISTARRHHASETRVSDAETATDAYEALITRLGGNKANLDTHAARFGQDAREKIERTAKQSIFKGMAHLLGVEARASVLLCFAFPGRDPDLVDELVVHGYHGLRRHRPELPLVLGSREMLDAEDADVHDYLEQLRGGAVSEDGQITMLREFSSSPPPPIEAIPEGRRILYVLRALPDELPGEDDLFFASLHRGADPRFASPEHPRARYAFIPHNPSRHMICDVYVHRELWQGSNPELVIARTGNPGAPDLLAHQFDRADFIETLRPLGELPTRWSSPAYLRQRELLIHIHKEMGWTPGDFRLYRCSIRYPVPGVWYTVQFPLPTKPGDE